jgi:hypothetical protein
MKLFNVILLNVFYEGFWPAVSYFTYLLFCMDVKRDPTLREQLQLAGDPRRLHNEELLNLSSSPITITVVVPKRIGWVGNIYNAFDR